MGSTASTQTAQTTAVPTRSSRGRRAVAAVALTAALVAAGGGAAALAAPSSAAGSTVLDLFDGLGVDWSAMPTGYTPQQYQAFWGAGYTVDDVVRLQGLWHTDESETKARAGQMLMDGERVPVAPSDPQLLDQQPPAAGA